MSDVGTIGGAARVLGHYRWVELRLFGLLGGWAAQVPEVEVKRCLATHAHHHAWHAELWDRRLPPEGEWSAEQVTLPPGEAVVAFFDALEDAEGAGGSIEKLTGLYRVVVPRMISGYTRLLASMSPVSDGPTIRALRLAIADETEDWQEGEGLLQALLVTPGDVAASASWQARIETLLVDAGGLAGI